MGNTPSEEPENLEDDHEYTWTAGSFYEFRLLAYCLDQTVAKLDPKCYEFEKTAGSEFEYAPDRSSAIPCEGSTVFHHKEHSYVWTADVKNSAHSIATNGPLGPIIKMVDNYIRKKNPLRNKNLMVYEKDGSFQCLYSPSPGITLEQCIIDEDVKQEIYDNTILHLKAMDMNNGIILHGPPGTGKSLLGQAVITEALKEGFSCCTVTTSVRFSLFGRFVEKYLAPCIVIFEDIDAFTNSRKEGVNPELTDFLQLISSATQANNRIIYLATTNHLDLLDEAVKRPARFNRRYEIGFPKDKEIGKLVDLYFGADTISRELKGCCCGCKFTGAHIQEIYRTSVLESVKNGKSTAENFPKALKKVKENFKLSSNTVLGFGVK
jgi:predicted AAA+ superfamily ATPase